MIHILTQAYVFEVTMQRITTELFYEWLWDQPTASVLHATDITIPPVINFTFKILHPATTAEFVAALEVN